MGRKTFAERIAGGAALDGARAAGGGQHACRGGGWNSENDVIASLIASFDVWGHHLPALEVHGSEGSLALQRPNMFDGEVSLVKAGAGAWERLPWNAPRRYWARGWRGGYGARDSGGAAASGERRAGVSRAGCHVRAGGIGGGWAAGRGGEYG